MVRIIVKYKGISRIVYEGYHIEIGDVVKKTVEALGYTYYDNRECKDNMVFRTIEII